MRAYLALMLSFGVYLFPLPSQHHQFMSTWGKSVLVLIHNASDFNPPSVIILGLVVLYQLFCAYCIYKLLEFTFLGILVFGIPLILFLYGILLFAMSGRSGVVHFFQEVWKIVSY